MKWKSLKFVILANGSHIVDFERAYVSEPGLGFDGIFLIPELVIRDRYAAGKELFSSRHY